MKIRSQNTALIATQINQDRAPQSVTRLRLKSMSMEQNPPLNIQVNPKTRKIQTFLAHWIHHLIRISQKQKNKVDLWGV